MLVKTYRETGINWNWYLRVGFNDNGTVEILAHYRVHKGDNGHPTYWGCYRTVETKEDRVITHVLIDGKKYEVSNPSNTFSYSRI